MLEETYFQRYGLQGKVSLNIDDTIKTKFQMLRGIFGKKWSYHHCSVLGCGKVIIGDGGMKPHRKVLTDYFELVAWAVSILAGQ